MKTRTLLVMCAALAVASCSKNDFYSEVQETRTITATFSSSDTKTTNPDGYSPRWAAGDQVWLSDGNNTKTVTLVAYDQTPEGDQARIADPEGKSFICFIPAGWGESIYSVYPAACATGSAGASGIGFSIPYYQNGTFASANICVAAGNADLKFKNATAVVKFTQPENPNDYLFFDATGSTFAGTFNASIGGDGKVSLTLVKKTGTTVRGPLYPGVSYYAVAPAVVSSPATKLLIKVRKTDDNIFADRTYSAEGGYSFEINKIYTLAIPDFQEDDYDERMIIGGGPGYN